MINMENKATESMKEKFDKAFPEAKILREHELKKTAHYLFSKSSVGKTSSIIYLIIALCSVFVYWKLIEINIFLSIIIGVITWLVVTYVFDKILIKIMGIEQMVRKINDEEIETSGKELEDITGIPMDKFLNK